MFTLIFPSGVQSNITREGAHNICRAPSSRVAMTRKPRGAMAQHVLTITDTEHGDTCQIILPPSDDGGEFRHYLRKDL